MVYRPNEPGEDLTLTNTGGGNTSSVAARLGEAGQNVSVEDPAGLTKVILDSLAFRHASVLRAAESPTGVRVAGVRIVGGGSRDDHLNRATADATGLWLCSPARSRRRRRATSSCRRSRPGASRRPRKQGGTSRRT